MRETIIPGDKPWRCYECHKEYSLQVHHCLHGTGMRKLADRYGLTVHLCAECHTRLHDRDHCLDRKYQRMAQQAFEDIYGHEKFMEVFGKNYFAEETI